MQSRALERAFADYRARVDAMIASGAWEGYGDLFTEDAVYRRRGAADVVGREAIRSWILRAMHTVPGNRIVRFDVVWRAYDHRHDQVVYELRHVMDDPGDGSVHAASTISLMSYAGDGLWSRVEDVQNTHAYTDMYAAWLRIARAHGTVPDEGEALVAAGG